MDNGEQLGGVSLDCDQLLEKMNGLKSVADFVEIEKTVFFVRKKVLLDKVKSDIDLKIDEAKLLISQNKYSFTEISDKLCFNSVHNFSRLFKQKTDMSPSEYAKSIKVDNLIK
jgi:AraC-like DNA-binding protein